MAKKSKSCAPGIVKMINMVNFEKATKSKNPIVVQMYSNYCGACEDAKPLIEAAACQLQGKAEVYKVDVDANPSLADKFKIDEIPTVLVMQDGKVKKKTIGLNSSDELIKMVKAVGSGKAKGKKA